MLDDSWAVKPATELATAIADRHVKSRELLELYLDRIERIDGPLGAVATLDAERAARACDEADVRTAGGASLPPLHGLPITIKDAIETAGIRSTGGAVELADHIPEHDAPAVARLRAAGAIVFGKTNLPRWSADAQAYNEMFGTTSNPWDRTRVPGGSSGGAAAAVAAGLTSFELGTDIGGSVRIPAHCCGTFALKPSYGVVPQRGYLDSVGGGTTDADINVFGPIARSAGDLDVLLSVLAAPVSDDGSGWRLHLPEATATSLRGLRIAAWLDDPGNAGERAMLAVLRGAIDRLATAGARVEEVRPPVDPQRQFELFLFLLSAAMSVTSEDGAGAAITHRGWLRTNRRRVATAAAWSEWFGHYDALVTPVLCCTAFPHQHDGDVIDRTLVVDGEPRPYIHVTWWTGMFGVIGLPAAVAPVGRTVAGLPVGLQIVTPLFADRLAVRLAGLVTEVVGGYDVPPGC